MELIKKYPVLDPIVSHSSVITLALLIGGLVGGLINLAIFGGFTGISFVSFAIYATAIYFSVMFIYRDNIIPLANTQELGFYGIFLLLGKPIPGIILYGSGNYALLPFNILRIVYVDMRPVSRVVDAKGTTRDGTPVSGKVTVQYRPIDVFRVFFVSESLITEGFGGIINQAVDVEVGQYDYLDIVASKKNVHDNIIDSILSDISGKPGDGNDLEDYNVTVMSVTSTDFRANAEDEKRLGLEGITQENIEQKSQKIEQDHYNSMVEQEYKLIMRLDPKMDKSVALMKAMDQINMRTGKMQQPTMQRIVFEGNQVDSLAGLGALMKGK